MRLARPLPYAGCDSVAGGHHCQTKIPGNVPSLMLSNEWQLKSKRWGHPLHAMCSYMGMFPPAASALFYPEIHPAGGMSFSIPSRDGGQPPSRLV